MPVRSSRESYNAYQREVMRRRRAAAKQGASPAPSNTRSNADLLAEIEQLRYELTQRPTIYDLRRSDAIASHTQRITTDIDTYNLFRRCLHPDSRNSVSDEILHEAWLAFRNLEQLTYDKKKIPPPLPKDLGELLRHRMAKAATSRRRR
jgi:hypothetical protein